MKARSTSDRVKCQKLVRITGTQGCLFWSNLIHDQEGEAPVTLHLLSFSILGACDNLHDISEMNPIIKGGVASTVIFFSSTSTAALHWFVSPYIHKIRWQPGSVTFEAEMISWLATPLTKTIKFSDIRTAETNRPYVSFKANDKFYCVDSDHCPNRALLAKLIPQKSESAFKNL